MNSPTPVIQIESLAYAYGRAEAVHDLSLSVQPGPVTAPAPMFPNWPATGRATMKVLRKGT